MQTEYILIGEITRPQGVRGEVRVRPYTDNPARFEELDFAYVLKGGEYTRQALQFVRVAENVVILRIAGVEDRDAAETLRGTMLYIDRAHTVRLPKNADFICDLIDCEVSDDEGNVWGNITEVLTPGSNAVYVIKGAKGEILVPALKSVVLESDTVHKRMLLNAARMREVTVFDA